MQGDSPNYSDLLPEASDLLSVYSLLADLDKFARASVSKSVIGKCALGFSGGIDSSILAKLLVELGCSKETTLVTVGKEASPDLMEDAPRDFGIKRIVSKISEERIRKAALRVSELVNSRTLSHLEDCVAFYLIAEELASTDKFDTLLSANGPDELYCGYDRFRRIAARGYDLVKHEIESALNSAYSLQKQVSLLMKSFDLRTSEPFLDENFILFSLTKVPVELKISQNDDRLRKRIWRAYGRFLGLSEFIVMKPKKAMQYSMKIHPIVYSMLKRGELKTRFRA